MKKKIYAFFLFLVLFLIPTIHHAQDVAICGWDGVGGDEITFVLLRNFVAGEIIYFTEEDYSDSSNSFGTGEGHLAYTVPPGGLLENEVIGITESSANTYTVNCAGGSALHVTGTGDWSFSASDEIYAYTASNASSPWNSITEIHCFAWGSNVEPPTDQNPSSDWPNSIIITNNIGAGSGLNADLNDAARVNTTLADLQNGSNWTTSSGAITLSCTDFTSHMLPIELINFDATKNGREVILNWSTSSEINNHYFQIEHSIDGKQFEKVNKVIGAGNSELINHYTFLHKNPSVGFNYYRLKQVDFDGQFEYSDIVSVTFENKNSMISVYPNPCTDHLNIDFNSGNGAVSYQIFSALGDILLAETIIEKGTLNIYHLEPGVYFIHVENGNNRFVHKIVKQY